MARQSIDDWDRIAGRADHATDGFALFVGDAVERLGALPDECIHTSLTSPPYWSARDYSHPEQLGIESEVDDYVERLVKVYREVWRVLRPDGTAWLNIGDSYFSGAGTVDGKPPRTGWKRNKQLALVPFRVALSLQDDGWWIRNVGIWHKPNAMPSSVRDRLTNTWEPVFLLAKAERYYFNLNALRVPHITDDTPERLRAERGNANGKAKGKVEMRRWLNSPRHRTTIEGLKEIERRPNAPRAVELAAYLRAALEAKGQSIHWIAQQIDQPFERTRHYFRTDEIGSRLPPASTWEQLKEVLDLDTTYDEAMTVEVGDNVFRNHPLGRNPGDMMSVTVGRGSQAHFATMPLGLAEQTLRGTLPPGGVCLDPFMGTGTTGRAALALGGRFVGIDVNATYLDEFLDKPVELSLPFASDW